MIILLLLLWGAYQSGRDYEIWLAKKEKNRSYEDQYYIDGSYFEFSCDDHIHDKKI